MFNIGIYILYAFVGSNLYVMVKSQNNNDFWEQDNFQDANINGKLALVWRKLENMEKMQKETLENRDRTRCVVTDAPIQCGAFCLAALNPLYNDMDIQVNTLNKSLAIQNRMLAKINTVEQWDKSNQYGEQLKGLAELLKETQEKLGRIEAKINAGPADTQEIIPTGFEKIGSRYFYFEDTTRLDWLDARDNCRQKGAYLASVQNQEELDAINGKVHPHSYYWLGINKLNYNDDYVNVASGKPTTFFNMWPGLPNGYTGNGHCMALGGKLMSKHECDSKMWFICQLDSIV
ncbi:uncharacterized protein LOC108037379 [Drosophila rhopaloa]|uniref:Uncharacterized protein LOC108037379 n=1 Tax=Drosophila rhopaloa TaxID=1041015 RepID=A0A6P4DV15_DRORH|nr:uncharacterized protein LOC108037379 [Drosophila rhopaloa]